MSSHRARSWMLAVPGLLLVVAGGCSSSGAERRRAAELEARIDATAEARLRALFPEVRGELSRSAITDALLGSELLATDPETIAARAMAAIGRGDFEAARQLLSEEAAAIEARSARALRAAGDTEGALRAYDQALDVAPSSVALRCERGETALADGIARGDRARIAAAQADFEEAARRVSVPRAWLGGSRAARALGQTDRAVEAARRGFAAARSADELEGLPELAERTRAEALMMQWNAASGSERESAGAEARAALEALIGRAPAQPWAWAQLTDLLQAQNAPRRAERAALSGLNIFPRDPGLSDALARSARALGGREAVVAMFEEIETRDPRDAGAVWRPAQERYERGIEALLGESRSSSRTSGAEANLREAQRGFLRTATIAPERRKEADTAAARSATGVALARLASGNLIGARRALLEAEELDPAVLRAPLSGSLPSGVDALRSILSTWSERGQDPSRTDATECLAEATECYADLRRIAPDAIQQAARAAADARDAALSYAAQARVAADKGRTDAAHADMQRARDLMEKAYVAAKDAAGQRPDDAAAVRLPGRLLVHFLQREVTQAESFLRKSAQLWEAEVARAREAHADPGATAEEREERARRLEEAESRLGDVYQDLGVLDLDLKGDAHGAQAWFEKALATGPDPREDVRAPGGWLERCEAAIADGTDPKLAPEKRWGYLP